MAVPLYKVTLTDGKPSTASDDGDVATLSNFTPRKLQLVPTCDATVMVANDVLAASEIWTGVCAVTDQGCTLRQLNVQYLDRTTGVGMMVVLLDANVGIGAENSAFSVADADAIKVIDVIPLVAGDFRTLGVNCIATLRNLNIPITPVTGSKDIYVALVSVDGIDLGAATDVVLTGFFE